MNASVSDYSNYDYEQEFWVKQNRKYEHMCECYVLRQFFKKVETPIETFVDAGCGFGRLFDAYSKIANRYVLLDYADTLLKQAQNRIEHPNISFVQGNVLALPFESNSIDGIMSMRVLHHITSPEKLFAEYLRVLKPGAFFILDIPNKRHLLNRVRGVFSKTLSVYLNNEPLVLGDHFYNFSPNHIESLAHSSGFSTVATLNSSYFRVPKLKQLFSASFLFGIDRILQRLLPSHMLTPSIYKLYQKR